MDFSRREFIKKSAIAAVGAKVDSLPKNETIPGVRDFTELVKSLRENPDWKKQLNIYKRTVIHEDQEHAKVVPISGNSLLLGYEVKGIESSINITSMLGGGAIPRSADSGLLIHTHPASLSLGDKTNVRRLQALRAGSESRNFGSCDLPSISSGAWSESGDLVALASSEADKEHDYTLCFVVVDSIAAYYVAVDTNAKESFAKEMMKSHTLSNTLTNILSHNKSLYNHFTAFSSSKKQGFLANLRDCSKDARGVRSYAGTDADEFKSVLTNFVSHRESLFKKYRGKLEDAQKKSDECYGKAPVKSPNISGYGKALHDLGYSFQYDYI